jgi:RNA polymerase sigma factor (sigma-70 family)
MTDVVEIFVSYSHADEKYRHALQKHLVGLQRQGVIQGWHDRVIPAGSEWAGEIDTHLDSASVILLLVSPDYLASNYCYEIEMRRALERHDAGEVCLVPILLRPVDLDGQPFSKFQILPRDAKPISTWRNRDEAFADVARGIRAAVDEIRRGRPGLGPNVPQPAVGEPVKDLTTPAAMATDEVDIELTIRRDSMHFSAQDKEHLLAAIGKLLETDCPFRVVCLRRGSVKLTLRMNREQAERLKTAIGRGELAEFGVADAMILAVPADQPVDHGLSQSQETGRPFPDVPRRWTGPTSAGRPSELETRLSLLSAMRQGHANPTAWKDFFVRYRDLIVRWCRGRGLQREDAEDVTQGVLLRIFEEFQQYKYDPARGRFRSWLRTVTNRAMHDYQRVRKLRGIRTGDDEVSQLLERVEAHDDLGHEIELEYQRELLSKALQRVRQRVSERDWRAFSLRFIERRHPAEVASELGTTVRLAYISTARVLKLVKREIESLEESDLN